MDFRYTEEQELLVKSLTELLEREVPESYQQEMDENHEFPWKAWKLLAENGILGLGIPEEYGGTPTDVQTMCIVAETLGRYAYDLSTIYSLGVITIRDIEQFGSDAQKDEVLGGYVDGGLPAALGISEPQAGSDAASLKTTAVLDGDTWFINGQKIYCTLSNVADHILLMARNPEVENPYQGMHMLLLPTDTPGVRINPLRKMGWWPVPTCEVFLDDVRLPKDALVGKENNGWAQLMANFEIERVILCAGCVGIAQAALDDAATYANQRVQFGKPIGKFQLIQEKLVDMAIKVENMRNYTYKMAWMMDEGIPVRMEHAMCKRYVTMASQEVIDDAMQILGGMGIMMDHRIQRLWRGNRIMRIGGGTDEIMINIAGPQLLKRYA
jgi:crotonobetainyl-CoA dehydrogenase